MPMGWEPPMVAITAGRPSWCRRTFSIAPATAFMP